jgi:cytochrome c553
MPTTLRRGFLTVLYVLRAMANASGELRFHGDRKPIRIQDIAKAAGADEKDTRRYLDAAERAGVVAVKGERRRGKPTLYALVMSPRPDWSAAVAHLDATKRERPGRKPGPWAEENDEKFGGRSPELEESKFGGPAPELTDGTEEEVRGPAPRWSSGDRPPNGSGDRPPNNPGSTQEISQEAAGVVFQPQVVGRSGTTELDSHEQQQPDEQPADFTRCARCHERMIRRPGRNTHAHCAPLTDTERHSA